jgi:hypothetical protein
VQLALDLLDVGTARRSFARDASSSLTLSGPISSGVTSIVISRGRPPPRRDGRKTGTPHAAATYATAASPNSVFASA